MEPTGKEKDRVITAKELERHHRTASIFHIDIKEIADESSTQGKLSSEATAKDAGVLNGFPIDLQNFLQQFADQFDPPSKRPPARPEDVRIELQPESKRPRVAGINRMNEQELHLLRETLTRLIDRGQIQVSSSPYGARIHFVKKPDGFLRLCVDYRDFISRKLKKAEMNYANPERELLALVLAQKAPGISNS